MGSEEEKQDAPREEKEEFARGHSLWSDAWRRLKRNRMSMAGGFMLICIILACVFCPIIQQYIASYNETGSRAFYYAPARMAMRLPDRYFPSCLRYGYWETHLEDSNLPPRAKYWLGTDSLGRDILTRMMWGGRISLLVGFVATVVSLLIGVTYGALAGYLGGRADNIMMRFVDIMYGLPFMFFVIILMVIAGQNIINLFIALGLVQWLTMSRITRGQAMSIRAKEYIMAAKTGGAGTAKILLRHVIPNLLGPVIVYATLTVPAVMLEESFLSFLGLGVQAPMTSWGAMASDGIATIEYYPWQIFFPGLALAVTLFSLNFLGDGLRDALDPQMKDKM